MSEVKLRYPWGGRSDKSTVEDGYSASQAGTGCIRWQGRFDAEGEPA